MNKSITILALVFTVAVCIFPATSAAQSRSTRSNSERANTEEGETENPDSGLNDPDDELLENHFDTDVDFLQARLNDTLSVGNESFTEPIEEIRVAAAEPGILKTLLVQKGDLVARDDLLMEMDMSVLEATREVARSRATNVARLRAAEVEYGTKTARYQKLVQLVSEGAGSPEEVQRAKADSEVARHNLDAIKEESNQYALEVKQYEAQIERRRVRSPINGVVTELHKKPGEYLNANESHVATIVKLDTLRAEFHIPTSKAVLMKQGDVVDVLFRDSGERVESTIEYVSPITAADSGRVEVAVLLDNKHRKLRSGVRCLLLDNTVRHSSLDTSIDATLEQLRR